MLAASTSSSNSSCCCDSIDDSRRSCCSLSACELAQTRPALPPTPGLSPRFASLTSQGTKRQRSTSIRKQTTMASASMTASMAASSFDKRCSSSTASSSLLQTPGSGTFPSEMSRSPMIYSPGFLKGQEAMRTPLTPPSAYLDFLKTMSPAMPSPMSTSTSSRFKFNEDKNESNDKMSQSPPESQPALSRNTSYESNVSSLSTNTSMSESSTASKIEAASRVRPESPRITIPPSPFIKPGPRSSRTPRRLQIPTSPFSPGMNGAGSPYSSTPLSAAPWSASFSPTHPDTEANGKPGRVSVRHTVTRTIVYCRTPLEPAPRGKRRKLDDSALPKVADLSASAESAGNTLSSAVTNSTSISTSTVEASNKIEDITPIKQEETTAPLAPESQS